LDLISCNEKLDIVFSKSNRAKIKPKKNIKLDTIKNNFPLLFSKLSRLGKKETK